MEARLEQVLVHQLQQLLVVVPDLGLGHHAGSVQHVQGDVVVVVRLVPHWTTHPLHQLMSVLLELDVLCSTILNN